MVTPPPPPSSPPPSSTPPPSGDDPTSRPAGFVGPTGSVGPRTAGASADPAAPAGRVDPADGPEADAVTTGPDRTIPPGAAAADDRTVGLGLTPAPGGAPTPGPTGTPPTGTPGGPSPRVVRERRALIEVDALAVGRGALPALAVAAGAALVARLLDAVADDGAPLALPLLLVALAGLIGGGWEAARTCARLPLTHAALAALVAMGVLLGVNVGWQLIDGRDVRWAYVGVWALLAVACGVVGGLLALRAPRRRADSVP